MNASANNFGHMASSNAPSFAGSVMVGIDPVIGDMKKG